MCHLLLVAVDNVAVQFVCCNNGNSLNVEWRGLLSLIRVNYSLMSDMI